MKVLHLLASGGIGGIENLMKDYGEMSSHENYFLFLWGGGTIYDEMKSLNMRVESWDIKKYEYITVPVRVIYYIKKHKIEAIVVHHASPLLHLCNIFIAKTCKEVKCYTYLHESAYDSLKIAEKRKALQRALLKKSYSCSRKVIAISNFVKQSLIETTNLDSEKVITIYNAIDCNKFHASYNNSESLQIIYVGRLIKAKGVDKIIRCLATIRNEVDFHFCIVGDGPEKDSLILFAEKMGLSNKITFLGNRRDISELLGQSDVFIHLPQWEEGFGITVVEAMASGLICIVNDHGALPELVINDKSGYVVSSENEREISKIILYIWENKCDLYCLGTKLNNIRVNAMERAKTFDIKGFSKKLDKLIEEN